MQYKTLPHKMELGKEETAANLQPYILSVLRQTKNTMTAMEEIINQKSTEKLDREMLEVPVNIFRSLPR